MKIDRRRMVVLGAAGAAAALRPAPSGAASHVRRAAPTDDLQAREASWYKKLEEGRVECQLCPQACTVADMERGMCGVRENRGGTYYTLVHGRACAVHVDPIEKKPFFHVMPGEKAFSFSTAGCNVECKFCQNWELSQFRPEQVEAYDLPPAALVEAAKRNGARLTAATYGEPVVFWEYVRDAAAAAERGRAQTDGGLQRLHPGAGAARRAAVAVGGQGRPQVPSATSSTANRFAANSNRCSRAFRSSTRAGCGSRSWCCWCRPSTIPPPKSAT